MKRIAIITLCVVMYLTGVCFAGKQENSKQSAFQQERTYYLEIIKENSSEIDYFAGDWYTEIQSIVNREMEKYGYLKAATKDSTQYVLHVSLFQWGVVTMAEPGKVFRAAKADVTIDVFSKEGIISSWTGSGEDTVVPEKQMVVELGRLILEDLIYVSQWAIADFEAQTKSSVSY